MIDSYADGLIDKGEFEPRILRLRQRMARLEEQRQQLAEEATLHTELQLIIGRLEDFAAKVHGGLEEADWASKRDLIRTLVKRVEVARDQVNIVFRVDPYSSDADPEKKSLQLCRGSGEPPPGQHIGCVPPFTHGVFNRAIRVHDANHDARPPRCNAHPVFFGSVKDSHMGQEGELLPDREVRRLVQDHSMTLSSPPHIP